MNFLELVNKNKDGMLNDLIKLLNINTLLVEQPENKEAPFGDGLKEALDYILKLGEDYGFKTLNVDNIAGHIEFGEGEEIVGVLAHLDVVPNLEGWKYDPFSGTIEGDKLYARGALDDKGPLISGLYAMKILKDMGFKPNKRIRLIIGTDEESKWRCIKRYLEVCEMPTVGFSPDAEFPIIYGEKGNISIDLISNYKDKDLISLISGERYNVVPDKAVAKFSKEITGLDEYLKSNNLKGSIDENIVTVKGKGAHAMEPNNGVNALVHLSIFLKGKTDNPLVNFIADNLTDNRFNDMGLNFRDPEMGDLTLNVAVANIDSNGGMVGLNMRYPINWNEKEFLDKFKTALDKYDLDMKITKDSGPHYVDKNSELIQTLHKAYIKYTNDDKTPLMTIGGGTYARALKNAVAFGMLMPGREDVVHEVDEYIYISDLLTATAIYTESIYQLGK
ncbi:MAG: dipeptidase PepV [Bacilli bacterium]